MPIKKLRVILGLNETYQERHAFYGKLWILHRAHQNNWEEGWGGGRNLTLNFWGEGGVVGGTPPLFPGFSSIKPFTQRPSRDVSTPREGVGKGGLFVNCWLQASRSVGGGDLTMQKGPKLYP